jgi:ATP/ADP translocase
MGLPEPRRLGLRIASGGFVMFHLLFALVLLPLGALHFLPTIIAALRRSRGVVGIFLLNLFLGWTVIGWIIALVWALTGQREYAYAYVPPVGYRRY